ncbi:hypothetical protein BGZ95_005546 [Linnemannia exigua]|uniref:F-box domain-containing protein n=1 Tax=Linnemannia exigua TaxID=604196 RepID=A0AAD4D261_9FUNG|nr:hypothetical protein BGZ95_005546 [Linnemannia exigua]
MDSMGTHPLALPEIVLTIGKFIPLWVPEQHNGETVWMLKPKDLIAASSVNRLFQSLLTPVLWATFAYPAHHSHSWFIQYHRGSNAVHTIPENIIEKNSVHFRQLDLLLCKQLRRPIKIEQLRLNCTRLQELRLSSVADATSVGQLIAANPGLRLLHWERSAHHPNCALDLRLLSPLHQLRSLSLEGWALNAVYLHHVLNNNADHLEELILGKDEIIFILATPTMNEQWNGLDPTTRSLMTKELQTEAALLLQGRPLLVPKLKSLHLQLMWQTTSDASYSLVRAFPAAEMITICILDEEVGMRLGKNLQEFCPNLRSIQNPNLYTENHYNPVRRGDGIPYIVNACAPGKLTHVALTRWRFDDRLRDALLQHRDGLEVLQLSLYHLEISEGDLENIGKVLAGCKRLKEFSLYNFRRWYQVEDTSILLDGLKCCLDLESLMLVGFPFIDRSLFDIEEEEDRFIQYSNDTCGEKPASEAELPTNWRYSPRFVFGPNSTMSTEEFRNMTFEVVADLPHMKTVILNDDRFEKENSYIS